MLSAMFIRVPYSYICRRWTRIQPRTSCFVSCSKPALCAVYPCIDMPWVLEFEGSGDGLWRFGSGFSGWCWRRRGAWAWGGVGLYWLVVYINKQNSWWPLDYTRTCGNPHALTRGYAGKGICRYGYGLCPMYPRVTHADPYSELLGLVTINRPSIVIAPTTPSSEPIAKK